jgi:outer membrane protein assembly factor BamB
MPRANTLRLLMVLSLSLTLTACSTVKGWFDNDDDEAAQPAELVEFVPEMEVKSIWSTNVGKGQGKVYNFLSPIINGERIYAAGSAGIVMALDKKSGKTIWKTDLDMPLSGGVGYGAGQILLGSSNGDVVVLDPADGSEQWRVSVSGEVLSAPQSNGTIVIVQSYDGKLRGLDADDGSELWVYDSSLPVLTVRGSSTPIIDGRTVMAGFASGKAMAFDLKTGAIKWDTRVAIAQGRSEIDRIIDIDGEMLLNNNILYAVSYQGRVAAIDVPSGRKIWQQDASSSVSIDQGFGNVYVSEDNGSVVAFYRSGQGVRWEQPRMENRRLSGPKTIKGFVAVGDFEGYVHFLSQVDGRFVGRIKVDGKGVRATMLSEGDVLYVFGNSGKLAALRVRGTE